MYIVNYCGTDYKFESMDEMLLVVGADEKKRMAIADALSINTTADVSNIVGCHCVITIQ